MGHPTGRKRTESSRLIFRRTAVSSMSMEIDMKSSTLVQLRHQALAFAVIGALCTVSAHAATTQQVREQALPSITAAQLAGQLAPGNEMALEERGSAPTVHGTMTVRMQQMYRGIPVYGRNVTVEQGADGKITEATGTLEKDVQSDLASVTPRLSQAQVVEVLRKHEGSPSALTTQSVESEQAQLYVYPREGNSAALVYLVSYFMGGNEPTRPTAIVDANSGQVLERWEGLAFQEVQAQGPGGNQKTGQYRYGTDFPGLKVTQSGTRCSAKNARVETYNLNRSTSSGNGTLWNFICPTSEGDAVNGAFSPINDAHHFGGVVFDMYKAYTGGSPLRQALIQRVHYGNGYENAFWDGQRMTFGDGQSTFYPLVGLDVVAHEVSHGFTEQNSGLEYRQQSGGMNEAFSDMAGEAAEFFNRGKNDFNVGSEIFKSSGALRYMCNPPQDGRSIGHAKDYRDSLDVHYSSGVYNKAFCGLAKTSGWNTEAAFRVFARANDLYWTARETFNGGACGVERAAADLGRRVADVSAAFTAVGVKCPGG
jgi:vibriolysin